jgi:hypothetical protein
MSRLVIRIAVVLLLSAAMLGGWGVRVAALSQEDGCDHMSGSSAAMAGHDDMARADQASAAEDGGVIAAMPSMGGGVEEGAPCCAPADDPSPAPCSTDHGAIPCGTAQACATTSALRASVVQAAAASLPAHAMPVAATAARVTGPVFAPDVPPPRGESPFRS